MLTALVVAVALAVGALVHKVSGSTKYVATCQFELALPFSSTQPTVDILAFNRRQAADELARAQLSSVFARAAAAAGVPVSEAAGDESITEVSDSSFSLSAKTSSPGTAVKLANALCQGYVTQLQGQLHGELTAEQDGLRSQITALERKLTGLVRRYGIHPRPDILEQEQATKTAISRNRDFLVVALSQPPYHVALLSSARGAAAKSTKPSLSKSLIIAAAAGLLLSFALILVLEFVRKRPAVEV
jgi:hypothetical protein